MCLHFTVQGFGSTGSLYYASSVNVQGSCSVCVHFIVKGSRNTGVL